MGKFIALSAEKKNWRDLKPLYKLNKRQRENTQINTDKSKKRKHKNLNQENPENHQDIYEKPIIHQVGKYKR